MAQATVEAAVAENAAVASLKGAADHVAARALVTHPALPDDFLYTVEYLDFEALARAD